MAPQSILLDLDDTLLNSKFVMARALAAYTGEYIHPSQWETYVFADTYGITHEEALKVLIEANICSHAVTNPGALELWTYCQQRGLHVEFVTARSFDPDARSRTEQALRVAIGAYPKDYTLTIVDHHQPKHEQFVSERPVLYVDDADRHVHGMRQHRPDIATLMVEQPWNAKYRAHLAPSVVKNMYDVIDVLSFMRGKTLHMTGIPLHLSHQHTQD